MPKDLGRKSRDGSDGSVRAVATDHLGRIGQLGTVVNEEATRAGELILLFWGDLDGEFNVGEVSPGELEVFGSFRLVNVDGMRLGVVSGAGLEVLERRCVLLGYIGAEFVSIGGHARSIGNARAAMKTPPAMGNTSWLKRGDHPLLTAVRWRHATERRTLAESGEGLLHG